MTHRENFGFQDWRPTEDGVYPDEFKNATWFDFHPETRWCFAIDVMQDQFDQDIKKDTYENARLISINFENPMEIHSTPVFIWNLDDPLLGLDYWYRYDLVIFDTMIYFVITDYVGIRVYDQRLEIIFELHITHEMKRYNEVYGFHVDLEGRRLVSWILINQKARHREALLELGYPLENEQEDEDAPPIIHNYNDVSLVPEEQRVYHNIF